jgi:hypothetical protein
MRNLIWICIAVRYLYEIADVEIILGPRRKSFSANVVVGSVVKYVTGTKNLYGKKNIFQAYIFPYDFY